MSRYVDIEPLYNKYKAFLEKHKGDESMVGKVIAVVCEDIKHLHTIEIDEQSEDRPII